jgi:hypothetical protein
MRPTGAEITGTGFLVIRMWLEGEDSPRLRARLHGVVDSRVDEPRTTMAAGRQQVLDAVDSFLVDFEQWWSEKDSKD